MLRANLLKHKIIKSFCKFKNKKFGYWKKSRNQVCINLPRNVRPSKAKSPIKVGAKHLMKSSSMPPAVATIQSTILCCTGKSLSEALLFAEYGENMLCTYKNFSECQKQCLYTT